MTAIEDSLRRALANGNAEDPAFRDSIYLASERALERMIVDRGLDPAAADAQRMKLAGAVESIERDHGQTADAPERPPASFAPPPQESAAPEPVEEWHPAQPGAVTQRARPRRGLIFVGLAALALLLILIYLVFTIFGGSVETGEDMETGALDSAPTETAAVVPPPATNWISVFTGTELESLTAPPGGRVELVARDGAGLVRISGEGGAPAVQPPEGADAVATQAPEVLLSLGPGLVGQIAGASVRVEIRAGSPDGEVREFAVRCQFAGESVCDRQRFATAMAEEAFVFDMTVPAGVGTPASLAIAPSIGTGGTDLDLFAVRMRIL